MNWKPSAAVRAGAEGGSEEGGAVEGQNARTALVAAAVEKGTNSVLEEVVPARPLRRAVQAAVSAVSLDQAGLCFRVKFHPALGEDRPGDAALPFDHHPGQHLGELGRRQSERGEAVPDWEG